MISNRSETLTRRQVLWLGAILVLGFALRLAVFLPLAADPETEWPDPDHYFMGGRILSEGDWHWTFRTVRYE